VALFFVEELPVSVLLSCLMSDVSATREQSGIDIEDKRAMYSAGLQDGTKR
jgi:hypothetical protein